MLPKDFDYAGRASWSLFMFMFNCFYNVFKLVLGYLTGKLYMRDSAVIRNMLPPVRAR